MGNFRKICAFDLIKSHDNFHKFALIIDMCYLVIMTLLHAKN